MGTTTPAANLHVKGTSGGNIFQLTNSAGAAAFQIDNGSMVAQFYANNILNGNASVAFVGDTGTGLVHYATTPNVLGLMTNGFERMRLDANGNVGINATSPLAILDVRGIGNQTLSGTIPVASLSGKTSFASLLVDNSGSGDLFTASSSGLNRFVITQAGNVGYWDNVPRETARQLGRSADPIGHG